MIPLLVPTLVSALRLNAEVVYLTLTAREESPQTRLVGSTFCSQRASELAG
jgi:hypothetical protein